MINIKKLASFTATALILASPLSALAQISGNNVVDTAPIASIGGAVSTLGSIVNWAVVVFWILTVLFLIWAAVIYLTAGGNEDKLKEARNRVIYALIAAAVALLSTGLQSIAGSLLRGQ